MTGCSGNVCQTAAAGTVHGLGGCSPQFCAFLMHCVWQMLCTAGRWQPMMRSCQVHGCGEDPNAGSGLNLNDPLIK